MDHIEFSIAMLFAFSAFALAYSSVPKIRRLEKRLEELESKLDGS